MLCHCWHKTTVNNSLHSRRPQPHGRHRVILLLLVPLTARPCPSQALPGRLRDELSSRAFASSPPSSSSSFTPSLSSPNECQTKSISFKGITFIYRGRWPGLVSSTLLPHPDRHVSLQCPSSLIFFTPSFSPTSGFLLAASPCCWFGCYQLSPPSPAQRFFYCKATDPLCAPQSWTFPPAFLPLINFLTILATVL